MSKRTSFKDRMARSVERDKQRASSYGYLSLPKNVSILKVDGDTRIGLDFIPYIVTDKNHPDRDSEYGVAVEGDVWYRRPFKIHRSVGANKETVVCPTSFGKPCPICEFAAQRRKEGADKEELSQLRASQRHLYIVIPVKHDKFEEEIHVWDYSHALFQKLLDDELQEDDEFLIFPDLENGLTVDIRFREESIGKTKFATASRIRFTQREEVYDESILEQVPNLDEMLNVYSYNELKNLFYENEVIDDEMVDDDEEIPAEEPAPPPITRKRKPAARPTPQPEPEEEEEAEEEPVRRPRKLTAAKKCPVEGLTFGVDTDTSPECETCEIWDDCIDTKEASQK